MIVTKFSTLSSSCTVLSNHRDWSTVAQSWLLIKSNVHTDIAQQRTWGRMGTHILMGKSVIIIVPPTPMKRWACQLSERFHSDLKRNCNSVTSREMTECVSFPGHVLIQPVGHTFEWHCYVNRTLCAFDNQMTVVFPLSSHCHPVSVPSGLCHRISNPETLVGQIRDYSEE